MRCSCTVDQHAVFVVIGMDHYQLTDEKIDEINKAIEERNK